MNRFLTVLQWVERRVFLLLHLCGIINLVFLFTNPTDMGLVSLSYYTRLTIYLLLLDIVLRAITQPQSALKLRNLLPDIVFITTGLFVQHAEGFFQFYLMGRQSYLIIRSLAMHSYEGRFFDKLSSNPPVFLMFTFMITIFMGTLLLLLPISVQPGNSISILDALFTSTSATCVTGLIVHDTGTFFSLYGQIVILLLIQVGGLGIMTISSAIAVMLGQKLTLKSENLVQNVVGASSKLDMVQLVKSILLVTIVLEMVGAALLFLTFRHDFTSPWRALYCSVFHSVSAFCNAGFSLFSDSFMSYRMNVNINMVISGLIIIGGIGFPVMVDVQKNVFRRMRISRLSMHSKAVLTCTAILIVLGTIVYFFGEYNATMKQMGFGERLLSSYFQSVTTRTAGFNTIDNGLMSSQSVFISIILMFIGASPGSTGGGIKTTALVIVIVSVLSLFRGNRDVNLFKRRVSEDTIKRVVALVTISLLFLSMMIFLLLQFEPFEFEKVLFEAVSAFGTVGLSMGITGLLSAGGKIIIIMLMYLGRIGPLTLIFAISAMRQKVSYQYIEDKISIG
jgi:trk system potassium uptake protein TrkH